MICTQDLHCQILPLPNFPGISQKIYHVPSKKIEFALIFMHHDHGDVIPKGNLYHQQEEWNSNMSYQEDQKCIETNFSDEVQFP